MYEGTNQKKLLTIDNLEHMEGLKEQLEVNENIYSIISPLMFVNQISKKQEESYQEGLSKIVGGLDEMGSKLNGIGDKATPNAELSISLQNMGNQLKSISDSLDNMQEYSDHVSPGLPKTQKTLEHMICDEKEQLRDIFSQLFLDDKHMMMSITFKAKAGDADKSEVVEIIKTYLEQHSLVAKETFVSGKPVLDGAIRSSMQDSMTKMMMLAIGVMIIVLTIVFKARWRLLLLGVILLVVVGTVGFMGWVNIPITMI